MGRYISWNDVVGRYPTAAQIKAAAGAENMGSYWLVHAEDEIDSRVACRYTVPFSPAPFLIQDLCIDLTYYKCTIRQKESESLWAYIKDRIDGIVDGTILLVASGSLLSTRA